MLAYYKSEQDPHRSGCILLENIFAVKEAPGKDFIHEKEVPYLIPVLSFYVFCYIYI